MSSKARLLVKVGTRVVLKDGREMQLVYWNRQMEIAQVWFPEAGNNELEIVPVSELCISLDRSRLFQIGAEGEQEGEENICPVVFLDGQTGEVIQKTSIFLRIFAGKEILHREVGDFEEEGGVFREIRKQPEIDNISLLSYGNCGILLTTGVVGDITEWDLAQFQITVFLPDQVRRISISNIVPEEGWVNGKRYRLRES